MRITDKMNEAAALISPASLRGGLEDGLHNGYDTSMWGWRSEDSAVLAPEFRVFYQSVLWKQMNTPGRTLESAFKEARQNFSEECRPPQATGLPATDSEWVEATENLTRLFTEGLRVGVSVELKCLLPESQMRHILTRDKGLDIDKKDTFYHLNWRESEGSSSTTWILVEGDNLIDVLAEAANLIDSTLEKIEKSRKDHEAYQVRYRERMKKIRAEEKAQKAAAV